MSPHVLPLSASTSLASKNTLALVEHIPPAAHGLNVSKLPPVRIMEPLAEECRQSMLGILDHIVPGAFVQAGSRDAAPDRAQPVCGRGASSRGALHADLLREVLADEAREVGFGFHPGQ